MAITRVGSGACAWEASEDGIVTDFIPEGTTDPDKYATSGGEGIWVDATGAIYSGEVKQKTVVKYVRQ